MRELIDRMDEWCTDGTNFALATVVRTFGSTPSLPGAALAVAESGEVIGGISGGCVEAAVIEAAHGVLDSRDATILTFDASDDRSDVFAIGLSCGGAIEVLVKHSSRLGGHLRAVAGAIADGRASAIVTVVDGPESDVGTQCAWVSGTPASPTIPPDVVTALRTDFATTYVRVDTERGESTVFVHCFAPPPRLIVYGARDCAAPLARMAKTLGYRTILVDARATFATPKRFPDMDEVVVDWPHRYLESIVVDPADVLCVLTHDAKFALPLLENALSRPFAYIGAMGSRATCAERARDLAARGVAPDRIATLHAPIGLDIGGRTPVETALSILAEIVATRERRTARPLAEETTPVHAGADSSTYRLERV